MRASHFFVKVSNPADPTLFFEEEFQFDPTAVYSFVPEWRREKIEIRPLLVREIILPSGRRELRLAGEVLFTGLPMQEPRVCPINFSTQNSPCVLGVTAFEDLTLDEIALRMSESVSSRPTPTFEKGESVKIIDGPFARVTGIVENSHRSKDVENIRDLNSVDASRRSITLSRV
jgi:hypothetical protein